VKLLNLALRLTQLLTSASNKLTVTHPRTNVLPFNVTPLDPLLCVKTSQSRTVMMPIHVLKTLVTIQRATMQLAHSQTFAALRHVFKAKVVKLTQLIATTSTPAQLTVASTALACILPSAAMTVTIVLLTLAIPLLVARTTSRSAISPSFACSTTLPTLMEILANLALEELLRPPTPPPVPATSMSAQIKLADTTFKHVPASSKAPLPSLPPSVLELL